MVKSLIYKIPNKSDVDNDSAKKDKIYSKSVENSEYIDKAERSNLEDRLKQVRNIFNNIKTTFDEECKF